jgi:hypothetical protein
MERQPEQGKPERGFFLGADLSGAKLTEVSLRLKIYVKQKT